MPIQTIRIASVLRLLYAMFDFQANKLWMKGESEETRKLLVS